MEEEPDQTTRRVTAQRKFAQGAYVPPSAAAQVVSGTTATNSTNDRKETTATGCTENRNNVLNNHMGARSFLDVVSFHKSHQILDPVVLVERLREKLQEMSEEVPAPSNALPNEGEQPIVGRKRKRRAQAERENNWNVHGMVLRSRDQRKYPVKYSVLPGVDKKKNTRRVQPNRTARSNKSMAEISVASTSENSVATLSDFSVDDNRPLKYFTHNTEQPVTQSRVTPVIMGPPVTPSPLLRKKRGPINLPKHPSAIRPRRPIQCIKPLPPPPATPTPDSQQRSFGGSSVSQIQSESQDQNQRDPSIHNSSDSVEVDVGGVSSDRNSDTNGAAEYHVATKEGAFKITTHHRTIMEEVVSAMAISGPIASSSSKADSTITDYRIRSSQGNSTVQDRVNPSPDLQPGSSSNYYERAKSIERWIDNASVPKRARTIDEASDILDIDTSMNRKQSQTVASSRRSSVDTIVIEKANAKAAYEKEMAKRSGLDDKSRVHEAPTFWPSLKEFETRQDALAYLESIMPVVAKYGICKIVPPEGFIPPCKCDDDIRFKTSNQYTSRLYNRWGTVSKEICAIKSCLKAQNIEFDRQPIFGGVETSLPKLYQLVQKHGGLQAVTDKKKWAKIGEELIYQDKPPYDRNLEKLYFRFLLPYSTMSPVEREELFRRLEEAWMNKHKKLLQRANNPLHRQKVLLGDSEESSESEGDETDEIDDCTTAGETMSLVKFKLVAGYVYGNIFRNKAMNISQLEKAYWRTVILANEHICVNTASIDTSIDNLGFSHNKNDSYGNHPWNLKVMSQNPRNVLRSLGRISGVTVPTLNLGMVFSSNCWHRDPHHLPWIEYLHSGAPIIRYGIPEHLSEDFRRAAMILSPSSCQNKPLWLPSDITMIPPALLASQNVNMYKLEQNPGEFVMVMPRAYSCSISTGFTATESVYFATDSWLNSIGSIFDETENSCEPTMFALEHLLKSIADDNTVPIGRLQKILPLLAAKLLEELEYRYRLERMGIKSGVKKPYDAPLTMEQSQPQSQRPPASSSRTRARRPNSRGNRPSAVIRQPPPPPAAVPSTSCSPAQQPKPPTSPPLPPAWSFRNAAECEICRRMLYLSKVVKFPIGSGVLCLKHANMVLRKEKYKNVDVKTLELHYRYSNKELQNTVRKAAKRVNDAKLDLKLPSRGRLFLDEQVI